MSCVDVVRVCVQSEWAVVVVVFDVLHMQCCTCRVLMLCVCVCRVNGLWWWLFLMCYICSVVYVVC